MGLERWTGVCVGVVVKVRSGTCVGMGSCVEVGLGEGVWVAVGRLARVVDVLDDSEEGINGWQATQINKNTKARYR